MTPHGEPLDRGVVVLLMTLAALCLLAPVLGAEVRPLIYYVPYDPCQHDDLSWLEWVLYACYI